MIKEAMARRTLPFSFPNGRGDTLSGLIDLPTTAAPLFYGVFGPCFTCIKESHGAARICRAIAERGGAMLRFDTTGIGGSTGDLSATNFTTRIQDLRAACGAMAVHHGVPKVLMGHSLSGPAAISAAMHLPDIQLIATICSPSDPERVIEKFRKNGTIVEKGGMIEVDVLGKVYTFKKEFVDDMLAQHVIADTKALARKLLVIHAPQDDIVDYSNADVIVKRAGAHGELMRLDDEATHLFNNRTDDAEAIASRVVRFFKGG